MGGTSASASPFITDLIESTILKNYPGAATAGNSAASDYRAQLGTLTPIPVFNGPGMQFNSNRTDPMMSYRRGLLQTPQG